jgi:hypothetical protein
VPLEDSVKRIIARNQSVRVQASNDLSQLTDCMARGDWDGVSEFSQRLIDDQLRGLEVEGGSTAGNEAENGTARGDDRAGLTA